jgi:hypothetical protein
MDMRINPQHAPLWQALQRFSFDESGTVFRFVDRLAKENHWSLERASRAIEEYKRFLFLAATAGHPVSPPDEVDQVWHLHLMYTRSYWDHLCKNTLNMSLHHEPTRGGGEETAKFADWYARTLAAYTAAFGHAPPSDIWPAPGTLKHAEHTRVDISKYLLLPKPGPMMVLLLVVAVALVVGLVLSAVATG